MPYHWGGNGKDHWPGSIPGGEKRKDDMKLNHYEATGVRLVNLLNHRGWLRQLWAKIVEVTRDQ